MMSCCRRRVPCETDSRVDFKGADDAGPCCGAVDPCRTVLSCRPLLRGDSVGIAVNKHGGWITVGPDPFFQTKLLDEAGETVLVLTGVENSFSAQSEDAGWGPQWRFKELGFAEVWHSEPPAPPPFGRLAVRRKAMVKTSQSAIVSEGDEAQQGFGRAAWSEDIVFSVGGDGRVNVHIGGKHCFASQGWNYQALYVLLRTEFNLSVLSANWVPEAYRAQSWLPPFRLSHDVVIHQVDSIPALATFHEVLRDLNDTDLVAVDCEWGLQSEGPSLVQVAILKPSKNMEPSVRLCFLLDTLEPMDNEFLQALRETLEVLFSHSNIFVWSFQQDKKRLTHLHAALAATVDHVVDLQPLVQARLQSRQPPSLARTCEESLRRTLDKSQQCSDWDARPLSDGQVEYATRDAYMLLVLQAHLERLQEAEEDSGHPSTRPFQPEIWVPEPREDITEGIRPQAARGRMVPSSYAEEYEHYRPIELKDQNAPAADWVSRLYTGGMVVNGECRLESMKPHPGGECHIVFVQKDDLPELYDASQQPEFRKELRKCRQGTRRRPRLVFPPFAREEGYMTPEPLTP